MIEEPSFPPEPPAVSNQIPGAADHPMAWNNNSNGIPPIGHSNSPNRGRIPQIVCDLLI
jgi:hypothetical protein